MIYIRIYAYFLKMYFHFFGPSDLNNWSHKPVYHKTDNKIDNNIHT